MRTFRSKVADHDSRVAGDLLLDIQVPGLHIGVLEVWIHDRGGDVCCIVRVIETPQRGKRLSSSDCDRYGKGWIGIQPSNDSGDRLVHLESIAGTQNCLSRVENVPGKSNSRLEVLIVLVIGIADGYERQ